MTDKNITHFLEMMKSFMNPEFYMNSIKSFPTMDFSTMSETISKSAKIMTTTNQIAAESLQAMFKKSSEDYQIKTEKMFNSAKEAIKSGDLKQVAEFQQEYLKSVRDTSLQNAQDFADMAREASTKISDTINTMVDQMSKNVTNINIKNKS